MSGGERHRSARLRRGSAIAGRALLALGLAAWTALPVAGYVLLERSTASAGLAPPVDVWAPVQPGAEHKRRTVGVVLSRAAAPELYAPAWSGVVEATSVSPGAVLHSGDIVATVAGIDRMAVASERPFSTELRVGDEGDDAAALNELLRGFDLDAPDSDRFTVPTLRALREFARSLRVPGTADLQSFDPAWLVYLPSSEVTIATSALYVGALAPAPGQSLATTRPAVTSAVLDAVTTADAGEGGATGVQEAVTAAESERLEMVGTALPLSEDRRSVAASGFPDLQRLVADDRARADGVLVAEVAAGTVVVPSAALGADGSCVLARTGGGAAQRREVAVESSSLGRSTVSGDVASGDEVLVAADTGAPPC
ncbi:hypothetical protein [Rathayibacter rathayi]|uniref:Peptidoglycan binding-like domain-containing protein n=1 Tax=Rathayibacter rathayi TaxID=33887 RepID=A0ABD6W911_RATRA|nr:hypothetical protein [Rathayibacter rathayi]PPF14168.1 hypothetical protein C5C04_07745 [Rathayibacter rathayi]PPF24041.1 hypothetical protein C5C34_06695 [Rathayibacter rathayi]PPF80062.1 hypothetical protein C5C14_07245 [Rathayibacter rathayi]PPG13319.1 hypothetical protein C5C11_07240 [Rathayibacter rathayi]PPG43074.1 hypothetical protein C5C20_08925 [Rathayibacter rathayi]